MLKPFTLNRVQKLIAAHIKAEQKARCLYKQSVLFVQGTEWYEAENSYKAESLKRTEKLVEKILFTIREVK